jgi:hypothetical protein
MKKLIALLILASFGVAVVGCGKKPVDANGAPVSGIKDKTPKTDEE